MSRKYDFKAGLAMGEKLEVLANDPVFLVLASQLAPAMGVTTKRSATDAKGMLLFGAATVLAGSDRVAEAEVGYQWPLLKSGFARPGVASSPPTAASWRYYRRTYLTEDVVAKMMGELRDMWVGQAKEVGLFPDAQSDHDLMNPDHLHTVYADGTWFAPASRTGIRGQRSKAKTGAPRLSEGVSVAGKLDGYRSVWVLARLPGKRMRLVLDFARAPDGEIPVVLNSLEALRDRVGDGLRHFVYDRALSGHDQITRIVEMGVLPITKPNGVDAFSDWDVSGETVGGHVLTFEYDFDGCTHRLAADYGMLWDVNDDDDRKDWKYVKQMTVDSITRRDSHGYAFDYDLRLRCGKSWHRLRVDLTEPLVVKDRKPVRLAGHLKSHPMADVARFAAAYGIRNDVEAAFSRFKNNLGMGPRAGSYTRLAHEIDLLLLALTSNALVWAEWKQKSSNRRLNSAA